MTFKSPLFDEGMIVIVPEPKPEQPDAKAPPPRLPYRDWVELWKADVGRRQRILD